MVRVSNLEILQKLIDDSRTPFVRIAEEFGISDTAIRKRIKKMEKKGIIGKYTIDINPKKLGFEIHSIIGIDTTPESYLGIMKRLKEMVKVVKMYSSSGDHMILIESWFRDSEELAEFIKMLEDMEGVTKTCPAIILERIK